MCFLKTYKVEYVENPDAGATFTVFDSVDAQAAQCHIVSSAELFINNRIVTRALEEATKLGVEKQLGFNEVIPTVGDRTVVLCSVLDSHHLYPEIAHPEVVYTSHDVRLQGKTVVMQLKDFSFLAMWSLTFDTSHKAEVRLKFGLESDSVITYNHFKFETSAVIQPIQ